MDTVELPVSKASRWTGRAITALLVLFLLLDGIMKVMMVPQVREACAELGLPESAIPGIGVTLIVSTLLYAVPATSVLGAILLTGYLGGAILTHVRVGGPVFPVVFCGIFGVLVWLGLFLRDRRLQALIPLRRASG